MIESPASARTDAVYAGHHPDIQRALFHLHRAAPQPTLRAAEALRALLRNSYAVTSALNAWTFSRLTGDGFPVEVCFATGDASIRYTADVSGSELAVSRRLPYAIELLHELGEPGLDSELRDILLRNQETGDLRYGAWVGGRHTEAADRFKLYAEVPSAEPVVHAGWLSRWLERMPGLPDRPVHLRMLGYEPSSQRLEFYFHVRRLKTYHLARLLWTANLQQRAGELIKVVEELHPYPLRERVPGGSIGFSYTVHPDQNRNAFTLFVYARSLWGGDSRIRPRFAAALQDRGIDSTAYLELTAPLAHRDVHETYHAMVGITMMHAPEIQLSLGVRPPPLA